MNAKTRKIVAIGMGVAMLLLSACQTEEVPQTTGGGIAYQMMLRYTMGKGNERGLTFHGIGLTYPEKITHLKLEYFSYQCLREEEARKLLDAVVEELLGEANQCEELRPYLESYPLTKEAIQLGITFKNGRGGENPPYPCVQRIFMKDGNVTIVIPQIVDGNP